MQVINYQIAKPLRFSTVFSSSRRTWKMLIHMKNNSCRVMLNTQGTEKCTNGTSPFNYIRDLFMQSRGLGTYSLKDWDPVTYDCTETMEEYGFPERNNSPLCRALGNGFMNPHITHTPSYKRPTNPQIPEFDKPKAYTFSSTTCIKIPKCSVYLPKYSVLFAIENNTARRNPQPYMEDHLD